VTHLYTLLVGGTVIPGRDAPDATAIAWADGTVLAIGDDRAIRGISRGDSHLVDLAGATVVALDPSGVAIWPTDGTLEVGGPADLVLLGEDPRSRGPSEAAEGPHGRSDPIAVVKAGRIVAGRLPGSVVEAGGHHHG
jgi:imidazolonepropionase-like amidohydrolase